MNKPIQPQEKFVIRFPDGMRDRIAEAADRAGRSMNAEIVHRLEASFQPSNVAGSEGLESRILDRYSMTIEILKILEGVQASMQVKRQDAKPRSKEAAAIDEDLKANAAAIEFHENKRTALFGLLGMIAVERAKGRDVTSQVINELIDQFKLRKWLELNA